MRHVNRCHSPGRKERCLFFDVRMSISFQVSADIHGVFVCLSTLGACIAMYHFSLSYSISVSVCGNYGAKGIFDDSEDI
jgi:hypothetical protein